MGHFSMSTGGGGGIDSATAQAMADAAEDAAAVYTDSVMAALAAADVTALPLRPGVKCGITNHTGLATGAPANRVVNMAAFRPAWACTLASLNVEATAGGEAGSKIRLLIIEDVGGFPTNVLWQSSDLDGTVVGDRGEDPNLAIVPTKLYYAAVQCHTAATTRPTLRYVQSTITGARGFVNSQVATARQGYSYAMGSDGSVTNPLSSGTINVGGNPFPMFWLTAD